MNSHVYRASADETSAPSNWLESAKRRGCFPRLFDGSGSRFGYVQVALFLYAELEGLGPETLHVLPLTVSVMQ